MLCYAVLIGFPKCLERAVDFQFSSLRIHTLMLHLKLMGVCVRQGGLAPEAKEARSHRL
jgi:hypothetical protein